MKHEHTKRTYDNLSNQLKQLKKKGAKDGADRLKAKIANHGEKPGGNSIGLPWEKKNDRVTQYTDYNTQHKPTPIRETLKKNGQTSKTPP